MKKLMFTCSTLCGTGLLFACASPSPMSALAVKPVPNVSSRAERPDVYYQLGRHYQSQNRLDQAIDAYRKALALDRNFVDARNALGAIYAGQGRLDEAVVEFDIVVAALPATSYAWNNLGYAYLLQGKSADAIATLERATAIDPTNQRAWNNLGTALAQRGESAAANEKFARAAELAAAAPAASPATSAAASPAASAAPVPAEAPAAVPVALHAAMPAIVAVAAPAAPAASLVELPAAAPAAPLAKLPAAAPAAPLAELPAAAPAVAAPTTVQTSAGERVSSGNATQASGTQPGPQPAAFADSPQRNRSFVVGVIDNTGTGELVQLAPSVYELRLAAAPPATAAPQPIAAQRFRLELSNGNGVTGMAKRLGELLAAIGLPKSHLTNQKPFRQLTTEIQYRDGYADVAASLRSHMPNQPPMIRTAALRASTDVRVVLGQDLPRDIALLDPAPEVVQVADAAPEAGSGMR